MYSMSVRDFKPVFKDALEFFLHFWEKCLTFTYEEKERTSLPAESN